MLSVTDRGNFVMNEISTGNVLEELAPFDHKQGELKTLRQVRDNIMASTNNSSDLLLWTHDPELDILFHHKTAEKYSDTRALDIY